MNVYRAIEIVLHGDKNSKENLTRSDSSSHYERLSKEYEVVQNIDLDWKANYFQNIRIYYNTVFCPFITICASSASIEQ